MKTFRELKVGDYIYYYDHCQIRKQRITSVKSETYDEVHTDHWNPRMKTVITHEKMLVIAGRNAYIWLIDNELDKEKTRYYWTVRFACKEAAEKYLKSLIDHRIKKANYLKEKLDQTLGILAKYETLNKDFDI